MNKTVRKIAVVTIVYVLILAVLLPNLRYIPAEWLKWTIFGVTAAAYIGLIILSLWKRNEKQSNRNK